jgi:hypothetical protein
MLAAGRQDLGRWTVAGHVTRVWGVWSVRGMRSLVRAGSLNMLYLQRMKDLGELTE